MARAGIASLTTGQGVLWRRKVKLVNTKLCCSSDLEDTAGLKLLAPSTVSGPASDLDSKHFGLLVIRIMSMMDKIIRMMATTMWIGNNDGVCGFQVTF